jgi:hypothetical protein
MARFAPALYGPVGSFSLPRPLPASGGYCGGMTTITLAASLTEEEEGGGYVAKCGIVTTEGDTMEEALAALREAVELYLAEGLKPTVCRTPFRGSVTAFAAARRPCRLPHRVQPGQPFGWRTGRASGTASRPITIGEV